MHSAIFTAIHGSEEKDWTNFLQRIAPKLARAKGVSRLAENVWLVNVQQSIAALWRGLFCPNSCSAS